MTFGLGVTVARKGTGAEHRIGIDVFFLKGRTVRDDDRLAVIEYVGAPGIPGPPAHRHLKFEEAWYILEGAVEFWDGTKPAVVEPGSYVHVPPGVPHTFRVFGHGPARWIGIFAPGRYVRLLEELGRLVPAQGPPDLGRIQALFAKYDTELVPGPNTADQGPDGRSE